MTLNKEAIANKILALLTKVSALTPEKCEVTIDPVTGELIKVEARVKFNDKLTYAIDIRQKD